MNNNQNYIFGPIALLSTSQVDKILVYICEKNTVGEITLEDLRCQTTLQLSLAPLTNLPGGFRVLEVSQSWLPFPFLEVKLSCDDGLGGIRWNHTDLRVQITE